MTAVDAIVRTFMKACVQPNGDSLRRRFRVLTRRCCVTPAFRPLPVALLSGDLLTDKIAIVTGAGRGIGEGIARKLSEEGATVVCGDVNEGDARNVASSLGHGAIGARLDVSNSGECDALVNEIQARFNRLDVLV